MHLKILTYSKEKTSYLGLYELLQPFIVFKNTHEGFVVRFNIKLFELDKVATKCIRSLHNRFEHESLYKNITDGVLLLNYGYKHLLELENEFIQHKQHSIVTAIEPFIILTKYNKREGQKDEDKDFNKIDWVVKKGKHNDVVVNQKSSKENVDLEVFKKVLQHSSFYR